MNYEEEYNAIVQRCRELHESGNALTKQQMEIVCPQLKDSEDERIRKEMIAYAKNLKDIAQSGRTEMAVRNDDIAMCNRWLSWLKSFVGNPKKSNDHWKPSKEQLDDLQRMIDLIEEEWGGEEIPGRNLLATLKQL